MAEKYNIRLLNQTLFDYSKQTLSLANLVRLVSYIVGVLSVLLSFSVTQMPFIIAFFSILAEILQWRSDRVKGVAESLLRKLDYFEGMGWPISRAEVSDILARSPGVIRNQISWRGPDYQYFDSEGEPGPRKSLENIIESAWWSKHLAETCGHLYLLITGILVLGSVVVLIVSIETVKNFSALMNVSRSVTATILLLFSLRLIRSALDFYNFSQRAGLVEGQARDLLKSETVKTEQIIKVYQEYHFARNGSPLIPTFVWKARRATLNDLWSSFQKSH